MTMTMTRQPGDQTAQALQSRFMPQRGFSLMELMIGMLLMAIGIMATISMQFVALSGYNLSRDNTNAAEVARRIESILKSESTQWSSQLSATQGFGSIQPTITTNSPFTAGSLMSQIAETTWTRVTNLPVDQRLVVGGAQRFCVFLQGARMRNEANILHVQVAVVYPKPKANFPGASAAQPYGRCDQVDVGRINPREQAQLELTGLRASYFGVHLSPRRP